MNLRGLTSFIPAFSYARLAIVIGILAFAGWVWRVNDLRADHLSTIDAVVTELKDAGLGGVNRSNVAAVTETLASQRNTARSERDTARTLVDVQSASIKALSDETEEYLRNAKEQKRLIAETIRQRDIWIKRSREAATRTERFSAEQELEQCEQVLDSLYSQSF